MAAAAPVTPDQTAASPSSQNLRTKTTHKRQKAKPLPAAVSIEGDATTATPPVIGIVLNRDTNELSFCCTACGTEFLDQSRLAEHTCVGVGGGGSRTDKGKNNNANVSNPSDEKTRKQTSFKCEVCNKKLKSAKLLKLHKLSHRTVKASGSDSGQRAKKIRRKRSLRPKRVSDGFVGSDEMDWSESDDTQDIFDCDDSGDEFNIDKEAALEDSEYEEESDNEALEEVVSSEVPLAFILFYLESGE